MQIPDIIDWNEAIKMFGFDWNENIKIFIGDGDHLICAGNIIPTDILIINGNQRMIHHWLYLYANKMNQYIELNIERMCNNEKCVNHEYWLTK